MEKNNLKLNITWLYPEEMSTYGDRGNILTLQRRSEWRGIDVKIETLGLKEEIRNDWSDIYFFGGGQDLSQILVSKDILKYKKLALVEEAKNKKVFLGICGGYQLFGHYYRDSSGNELAGLGILDVITEASQVRMMGNILVEPNFLKEKLVGFENHSGKTKLGERAKPLGTVVVGAGNNGDDRTEGATENNVYGSYLHGPVLPKNPLFADYLIKLALQKKYGELDLKFINDNEENLAHEVAIRRTIKTH